MKKLHIIAMLIVFLSLNAQALFEVKDASDNTVLEVSADGLRIFNEGDTLMVISSSEIKAFILESAKDKALSRSFSVTTSAASGKGDSKMFEIAASDGAIFYNPTDNSDQILSINQNSIIANVNPTLDRDFIINDQAAAKGGGNLMKISNEDVFTAVDDSTMLWYKQKNAFRVGHVLIVDDTEVGQASFGAGRQTKASGDFSTALGNGSDASAIYSFASGNGTIAEGWSSTAMGFGSIASGSSSTAMGKLSRAIGSPSTAMGYGSEAIGINSTAMGWYTNSEGSGSTSMGCFTTSRGSYSTAMNYRTEAIGYASTSMGSWATAQPYCSFVMGQYNEVSGDSTSWVSTDPVFTIGNGSSDSDRSNAFEVKKNGNTFVGGDLDITGNSTVDGYAGIGASINSACRLNVAGNEIGVQSIVQGFSKTITNGIYGIAGGSTVANRGVYGGTTGTSGVLWAGYFAGNINVTGTVQKSASKTIIDHPLDPTNKFLTHSSVESDQMMNIYNGVTFLNSDGTAVVTMPDWFESLNTEFRYQLTAIGAPGPNLYISRKISGNTFEISGGVAKMEVSWQVTGVRQDNFAKTNPIEVETSKDQIEKGYYLHPEAYGQPEAMGIEHQHTKRMEEQSKK